MATLKQSDLTVKYKRVGKNADDFEVVTFHDASFGNLPKGGSQGGIFLGIAPKGAVTQQKFLQTDISKVDFVPLWWKSFKLQRVARSTFAGETLCALEGLDTTQHFREFFL